MTARVTRPHLPTGRPTKYQPQLCRQVIEYCAQGYSLTAFAGNLRVSRADINVWMDRHPSFFEAVARAKAASVEWWESRARELASSKAAGGSAQIIIFMLKNHAPDDFRDRVEVTGRDGGALALDLILGKMSEPVTVEHEKLELPSSAKDDNPKSSDAT